MDKVTLLRTFVVWILFVISAILNGAFRNAFLVPRIGQYAAHVVSSLVLTTVILAVTFFFVRYFGSGYSRKELILVGLFWMGLTILFEFVFGHYVMGAPWEALLADYNIFKGRLWSLVLLATLFGPLISGYVLRMK